MVKQFDVYLVALDPTMGREIKKTRPCVVISPDEMNKFLNTVIIAPMTSTIRSYPTRVSLTFQGKKGEIALDQIRTVDNVRLVKHLGRISPHAASFVKDTLKEIFS